jgi:hypothetical protein
MQLAHFGYGMPKGFIKGSLGCLSAVYMGYRDSGYAGCYACAENFKSIA